MSQRPPTSGTGVARPNSGATNDYLVWDPNVGQVVNWRGLFQPNGFRHQAPRRFMVTTTFDL